MKIKHTVLTVAALAAATGAFAQTSQIFAQDAIKFSTFQPGSTARVKAVGNASYAVGGDLSSISGNPAGIGLFTRSEMSITPEFNGQKTSANFLGSANSASKSTGNFNNASIVFYNRVNTPKGADKTKGLLSLNFGLSYNRTNDFYQNAYYAGHNSTSSISDYYAQLANNSNYIDKGGHAVLPDGALETIAYNQYLIDSVGKNTSNPNDPFALYDSNVATGVNQAKSIVSSGGQSEFDATMGGNISNKLYFGLGLGFTNIRYNSTKTFSESGTELYNFNTTFQSDYLVDQITKGNGFNARLGFIYRPESFIRLGVNFSTPTWYNITDDTREGITTKYKTVQQAMSDNADYHSEYNLRTPWRIGGGIAFVSKYGFITGDIDYVDYTTTHLSGYDGDADDNYYIQKLYRSTVNVRGGIEARVTQNLYLRGGYGIQGSPRKDVLGDTKTISGGIGYRFGDYYIDATYTNVKNSEANATYAVNGLPTPIGNLSNQYNNVYMTFGMRF